jgi:hypothetical protein
MTGLTEKDPSMNGLILTFNQGVACINPISFLKISTVIKELKPIIYISFIYHIDIFTISY